MFEYIKGRVVESFITHVILETYGIGYKINIAINTYSKICSKKEDATFFISTIVKKDDVQKLYGFLSRDERDLFNQLNDVSGIGAKTALSLIGHIGDLELKLAISSSNIVLISKVPGIGKKTAERLIVEMKDRLLKFSDKKITKMENLTKEELLINDAVSALVNLGYNGFQAQNAIKKIVQSSKNNITLSMLITHALKEIRSI